MIFFKEKNDYLKKKKKAVTRDVIMFCHGFNMLSKVVDNWFKLFLVLENLQRMQKLISFPSKLKLVCGIGLVKLKCWTLNQVHFLGTCSLHFTTLSTPSAMNILRMKWIELLRFDVFLCSLYCLRAHILCRWRICDFYLFFNVYKEL